MKYYPLSQTVAISLWLMITSIFIVMPIMLFYQGVPLSEWGSPLGKLALVGGLLAGTAIFMAWLFCELYASKIKRLASALIYAVVCPALFLCILGFALLIQQGSFLNGIADPKGKENLVFLLVMLSPICFAIYWSGSKKCPIQRRYAQKELKE